MVYKVTTLTDHVLDNTTNGNLSIKSEYKNKNGNLDIEQLFDDIDTAVWDNSDVDILRSIRHFVEKRVEARQ
jgi:hypothetical protein